MFLLQIKSIFTNIPNDFAYLSLNKQFYRNKCFARLAKYALTFFLFIYLFPNFVSIKIERKYGIK